jgi:hypothetical protein
VAYSHLLKVFQATQQLQEVVSRHIFLEETLFCNNIKQFPTLAIRHY